MLDHLSDGRLQLGVGAGVSPIEVGFFEVDWDSRRDRFDETFEILLKGLASDELTHHGPDHHYDAVPMALRPVQQPHPPLWFGISHAGRAEWVAEHEVNVVALLPAVMVRPITDAYRAAWEARGRAPEDIPFMGVSRLIVVADTDDEAMSVARRAYRRWFESINLLWRKYEAPSPLEAVRSGRWKLHLAKAGVELRQLYDLDADPGEADDVLDRHPDVVAELDGHADRARHSLGMCASGSSAPMCARSAGWRTRRRSRPTTRRTRTTPPSTTFPTAGDGGA